MGNFGPDALVQTMATLNAAKAAHAGAGRNWDEASAPAYVKAGELTVALFSAYTLYHNFAANDQATRPLPVSPYAVRTMLSSSLKSASTRRILPRRPTWSTCRIHARRPSWRR